MHIRRSGPVDVIVSGCHGWRECRAQMSVVSHSCHVHMAGRPGRAAAPFSYNNNNTGLCQSSLTVSWAPRGGGGGPVPGARFQRRNWSAGQARVAFVRGWRGAQWPPGVGASAAIQRVVGGVMTFFSPRSMAAPPKCSVRCLNYAQRWGVGVGWWGGVGWQRKTAVVGRHTADAVVRRHLGWCWANGVQSRPRLQQGRQTPLPTPPPLWRTTPCVVQRRAAPIARRESRRCLQSRQLVICSKPTVCYWFCKE